MENTDALVTALEQGDLRGKVNTCREPQYSQQSYLALPPGLRNEASGTVKRSL
jgi:hypothetical protein